MKRALVVSHESSRTGAPRVAIGVARSLAEGGWATTIGERLPGPLSSEFAQSADELVTEPLGRVRVALRYLTKRLKPRPGWRTLDRLTLWFELWTAGRLIRRARPDLVWCNSTMSGVYAVAARRQGLRVVLHSHEVGRLPGWALQRTGVAAHAHDPELRFVACSDEAADRLTDAVGADRSRITVIESRVDVGGLRARSKAAAAPIDRTTRLVVACGLGNPSKGVEVFGQAAAIASHQGLAAAWYWVGEAPEEFRSNAVTYVGDVADAVPWLAEAAVVVVPSLVDTFPLVVLEAMALGKAIVASSLPGIVQQTGTTARLVPPGAADAVVENVAAFLADPGDAERAGRAAAARCEELWDIGRFSEMVRAVADGAA